jgi:hypothetical protein
MVTEYSERALPADFRMQPDAEPRTLDCYVDETELTLDGRRILIYGIAIRIAPGPLLQRTVSSRFMRGGTF